MLHKVCKTTRDLTTTTTKTNLYNTLLLNETSEKIVIIEINKQEGDPSYVVGWCPQYTCRTYGVTEAETEKKERRFMAIQKRTVAGNVKSSIIFDSTDLRTTFTYYMI
mmetsp:Transcript_11019/g.26225  ORF Transcript_11019/g.26225 Transcript_11019/m.26225 type:complete len:108 (-) Transcript_11019:16-339(-)